MQKKGGKNLDLIQCLAVCSLTIQLSLSRVNSICVKKRLLAAVTTTSKMRPTLQEEYEILIKPACLPIGSPQLRRWELHSSQRSRLTPGLPAAPSQLPIS